jgi:hypothetical protein
MDAASLLFTLIMRCYSLPVIIQPYTSKACSSGCHVYLVGNYFCLVD